MIKHGLTHVPVWCPGLECTRLVYGCGTPGVAKHSGTKVASDLPPKTAGQKQSYAKTRKKSKVMKKTVTSECSSRLKLSAIATQTPQATQQWRPAKNIFPRTPPTQNSTSTPQKNKPQTVVYGRGQAAPHQSQARRTCNTYIHIYIYISSLNSISKLQDQNCHVVSNRLMDRISMFKTSQGEARQNNYQNHQRFDQATSL